MTDFGSAVGKATSTAENQVIIQNKLNTLDDNVKLLHSLATDTFIDGVVFDSADEVFLSPGLDVSNYRDFAILIDLAVVGAPTDIVIEVLFSDDNVTYYKLMNGPFGDLRYEDSAGDKKEAITGKVIAPWMKINAISRGCDASNTFTLTVQGVGCK